MHKKTVTEIPNAFPHRNNLEMDIYGTEGIPEKDRLERERNKGAGTCNYLTPLLSGLIPRVPISRTSVMALCPYMVMVK